jgi:hypothetical protein
MKVSVTEKTGTKLALVIFDMGNDASTAVAGASAKKQFNEAMEGVNDVLGINKNDDDPKKKSLGPANKREQEQRAREREAEYKQKQDDRAARKAKLADQWAANKKANS